MKRWMKAELLPLMVVIGWLIWIMAGVDLEAWKIVAAFIIFCLIPVFAGIFYGHAVGRHAGADSVVLDALAGLEQLDRYRAGRGDIDTTGGA